MLKVYRALGSLLSVIKSRPRESASVLLVAALMLFFGFGRIVDIVRVQSLRKDCISGKKDILDSYEQVDELLDSAYRLDSYGRSDIDDLRRLKDSVDSMYERCRAMVPGWPD